MGNREQLLDGAVRCLYEKGYAHTTARDVAAAAGVSLAAIGYHFGSTEALLGAALHRAVAEWGEEIERALGGSDLPAATGDEFWARFEAVWARVIDSVRSRPELWSTQLEVVAELHRRPQRRELFAAAQDEGRAGLAALFEGATPGPAGDGDPARAALVGGFYQALLTGVVVQHLTDPARALGPAELARALRAIATRAGAAG